MIGNSQVARNNRLAITVLLITAAFVVADLTYSGGSHVSFAPRNFVDLAKAMATMAAIYVAMVFVDWRIAGDNTKVARVLRRGSDGAKALAGNTALFLPLAFASVYLMYLVADTQRPLMDESLANIDAAIGFRWRDFLDLANAHPVIARALVFAYHSMGPQLPILFIVLAFSNGGQRLTEFVTMLAVSSALTATAMAMVPAAGTYAYFQPLAEDFSNFTARAGMWHYEELMRLRSDEPVNLLVSRAEGLTTFPSFHTVLAIIVVYALRFIPVLAWPLGLLNAVMIVSTMPEGGHHLVDVLAGATVALLTVAAVRLIQSPAFLDDKRQSSTNRPVDDHP
ncbi:phosphatase PAP2 family protein [Mesorhizobium sp. PAMC28654]|uniref:phosphatase PAP2 family protein n=1 Tax=Mesorhizobium sp. PAMC28654 TaxID=2880934 RepID=UPI001D0A2296|nr:phosphatase PAP2 family protein [Mesorhizobium sp. PAMC28654]UDL90274.1 phosphatase PAP2 family protein [Mesorhizobium sp. PAMC28654]